MIESKEQLAYYIRQDALADGHTNTNPKLFGGWPNTIWKYKISSAICSEKTLI